MTYLNEIDPTKPAFDDSVGFGDDEIRNLKAALLERLSTIVEDIDADPWQIKTTAINVQLITARVSHLAFVSRDTPTEPIFRRVNATFRSSLGLVHLFGEIVLPDGSQLFECRVRLRSNHNNTIFGGALYRVFDNGGQDVLVSFAGGGGSGLEYNIGQSTSVLPFTSTQGDRFIFLVTMDTTGCTLPDDAQLLWASITANIPV